MHLDIDLSILIILIIFGFAAAFIDSIVGGGGLISLPALLFAGLNPVAAVATNKLASTMGAVTSTYMFYRSGKLDLKTVYKLFPLAFFGSILGSWTVHLMDPEVLKPLMLIMLAAVAVYTIFKRNWGTVSTHRKLATHHLILFMMLIFAIGFYDGFLGPGTGSFLIFAFLMIGFDFIKAAGNAKFLNFGSNIAGLLMFIILGKVHFIYGIVMGLAQIAGSFCGSRFAIRRGASYVRVIFIVMTVVLLTKNAWDFLK